MKTIFPANIASLIKKLIHIYLSACKVDTTIQELLSDLRQYLQQFALHEKAQRIIVHTFVMSIFAYGMASKSYLIDFVDSLNDLVSSEHTEYLIDLITKKSKISKVEESILELSILNVPKELRNGIIAQVCFVLPIKITNQTIRDSGITINITEIDSADQDPLKIALDGIDFSYFGFLNKYFSDADIKQGVQSSLIVLSEENPVLLDIDIDENGTISRKDMSIEEAKRGHKYHPYKEYIIEKLHNVYRNGKFTDDFDIHAIDSRLIQNYGVRLIHPSLQKAYRGLIQIPFIYEKLCYFTASNGYKRATERFADESYDLMDSATHIKVDDILNKIEINREGQLRKAIFDILSITSKFVIEQGSGWKLLWSGAPKQPRNEDSSQILIKSTSRELENANINMSREVVTGDGRVDFHCTYNSTNELFKVCCELKNAHHQNIATAVQTQLIPYMRF